jgi:hypothetical protein
MKTPLRIRERRSKPEKPKENNHALLEANPMATAITNNCFGQHQGDAARGITAVLSIAEINRLVGGKIGRFDVACPRCGPLRRTPKNQCRPVLRIWHQEPGFATFCCKRCGAEGWTADRSAKPVDPAIIENAKAKAAEQRRLEVIESQQKACRLWKSRQPIAGSIAEFYLRKCRGYQGELPGTLGFLPGRKQYPPAMVAAFGAAIETAPGEIIIHDDAVCGVHLTRLKPDGSGKAGIETEEDKITIGMGNKWPIMLAPPNDLLGLAIAEGIEDALSLHAVAGLGAWAAGSAGRLPAMADAVPDYIESVTIMIDIDADQIGERKTQELAFRLVERGIETRMARPGCAI